jgi:hypothetical protein
MRTLISAFVATVLAATSVSAQQLNPARPLLPPELAVAPVAPKTVPEPTIHAGYTPANICHELVAFLEQRAAAPATGAGTQPQNVSPGPLQQSTQSAARTQSPGQGAAAPPSAPPAVDRPQFSSGLTTSVPPAESGDKPPFVAVEQARAYEAANDLRACQEAARQMRRAGVPMPDGLIALAALRPDLIESADAKH